MMTPPLALWCSSCGLTVRDVGLVVAQQIIAAHRCDGEGLFYWEWEHRYADALAAVLDEAAHMLDAQS